MSGSGLDMIGGMPCFAAASINSFWCASLRNLSDSASAGSCPGVAVASNFSTSGFGTAGSGGTKSPWASILNIGKFGGPRFWYTSPQRLVRILLQSLLSRTASRSKTM